MRGEGEVQVDAGAVNVGAVRRRGEEARHAVQRFERGAIDAADLVPRRGDLDRVDDHAVFQELTERRHVVSFVEPVLHSFVGS